MYVHMHAFLASGCAFPGSAAEPEVSAEESDVFLPPKVCTTACENLDKLLIFKEAILECIF